MAPSITERSRLDEAARAGWLYYIAGHTQDEIAKRLKVSRATVQRLVALCLSERLITFRLEHPITACMDLAERLSERFGLRTCEVVPSDPGSPTAVAGVAERAAALLEAILRQSRPVIVAIGTGRAMRAAVEQVPPMDRPDHQLVSLVSNISTDGSATFFDTVGRLAELTKARHYPTPLPVMMASEAERDRMLEMGPMRKVRALAERADLRLMGVGQMDRKAQFHVDGFITHQELGELIRLGAVGELTGWAYDGNGRFLRGGTNRRLTSLPHPAPARTLTIAAALGPAKVPAIRAVLVGRLINGLITDEATAKALLS
ncbi:MAG: sugar-binding transcriptional regulator [Alphaproteobacteria bacterium]|nr:sugar-binding transcriptional regulator [Alphaproteobacteria bacterium]